MMMVLFQRKIIYMGYIPPGSRTEVGRAAALTDEQRLTDGRY